MNRGFSLVRSLLPSNLRHINYSTLPPEVVIYLDKQTIVCWHPEQPFPYEYSKPLPKPEESKTVLKLSRSETFEVYSELKQRKNADELAKLTQTTKHKWFPRSRDKRAKKTRLDREYL